MTASHSNQNTPSPRTLPAQPPVGPQFSRVHPKTANPRRAELLFRLRMHTRVQAQPHLQGLLLEACKRDIVFWFNHFAWTYDPRQELPQQPFRLYPYQEVLVRQLLAHIESGRDLLIEKSRDMGASWLIALTFQYYWLFRDGAQFLMGSRKFDLVEQPGNLSTLFEKLRYNLRHLPKWMHPPGFNEKQHGLKARLINPASNALIQGESNTELFARGGRYKAILLDEFAFWPKAELAFAAAGQSSPCRIVLSTPFGKGNAFARLRFQSPIAVKSLHWRLHPLKNEAWYEAQKARMSEDEVARELDINYNLSVRNRVFPEFTHEHKRSLHYNSLKPVVRVWDFGYHCPACVHLQVDDKGRLLVLSEVVGERESLKQFAQRVKDHGQLHYPSARFTDYCDPAGAQRSDKSDHTSIELLNGLGVYPQWQRSGIQEGLERIRHLLVERRDEQPALWVDPDHCPLLVEAFEGGYRYRSGRSEAQPSDLPYEEHPYEDVMDCLRYGVMAHGPLFEPGHRLNRRHKARDYRQNRGYDPFTRY
jgi:hypothetical protein